MTQNSTKKNTGSARNTAPTEVLIGLATIPVLTLLVGGKVLADTVYELGRLSEEFFRGDRLPLLNFPVSTPTTPDTGGNEVQE